MPVSMTLTHLEGPEALEDVARLLALVFEDQTPASIRPRLSALPVLVSNALDPDDASLLEQHLTARGARVRVDGAPVAEDIVGYGDTLDVPAAAVDLDRVASPGVVRAAPSVQRPEPTGPSPSVQRLEPAGPSPSVQRLEPTGPSPSVQRPEPTGPSPSAPEPPPWERAAAKPAAPWDDAPAAVAEPKKRGLFGGLLKR